MNSERSERKMTLDNPQHASGKESKEREACSGDILVHEWLDDLLEVCAWHVRAELIFVAAVHWTVSLNIPKQNTSSKQRLTKEEENSVSVTTGIKKFILRTLQPI